MNLSLGVRGTKRHGHVSAATGTDRTSCRRTRVIEARQSVHAPGSDEWDHSRLETMLEFFEKLASLFKLSGDMPFIYRSTLGWYAARYFLYAYEHNQVQYLRKLWKEDNIYRDIEDFFNFYVEKEVGGNRKARQNWKERRLASEEQFWEQERRD